MARRIWENELYQHENQTLDRVGAVEGVQVLHEMKLHATVNGVFSLQWNYNGTILAAGYGNGGVQLWDTHGKMIRELVPCRQGGVAVMVLRWHPKNPVLVYSADTGGMIRCFDSNTGICVQTIEELGNEINAMDFCVDGYNFVTSGKDFNVRVYDTKSNQLMKMYEGTRSENNVDNCMKVGARVFAMRYHPFNQYIFISGGWDNHIKVWDTRDRDGIKRNIRGPHICGDALDMKDSTILTGQWTALNALQFYDYGDGTVVKEFKYPHKEGAFLYTASYVNDNVVMAGGSGTNTLECMEISTNKVIGSYKMPCPVISSDSSRNGLVLACGGSAHVMAMLKLVEKPKKVTVDVAP